MRHSGWKQRLFFFRAREFCQKLKSLESGHKEIAPFWAAAYDSYYAFALLFVAQKITTTAAQMSRPFAAINSPDMIVRNTSKSHPELDFAAAAKLFEAELADKKLSGELITSAVDLFAVETLRDRHNLRVGDPHPTDIFVFGKGEPDNPACTKVGGRPFWPTDLDWPSVSDGSPCHFLAQFNFADSLDIIDFKLPGTILLLLTENEDDWLSGDDGLTCHWVSAGITPCDDLVVPSTVGSAGPFYAVRHRSADYPDAEDAAYEINVSQGYNLPVLNGTKIGGLPHFIQGSDASPGRFLCQLGSIQAAPDAPYPWTNRRDALKLQFNNNGIYGDDNCAVFGDMGSVYLFVDDNGAVSRSFECY